MAADGGGRTQPVVAWLLPLPGARAVAVGEAELRHILVDPPELHPVPGAPPHCARVLLWEEMVVPLLDLGRLLDAAAPAPPGSAPGRVVIVACRDPLAGALRHGALLLAGVPARVAVSDEDACPPPPWAPPGVTLACFRGEDGSAVPVLDLGALLAPSPAGGAGP